MVNLNLAGVSPAVIVRGVMTVIAATNVILGYLGYHLIPLSEGEVGEVVNGVLMLLTAGVWGWGWWKNNSLTLNAQRADDFLRVLKEETDGVDDEYHH